MILNWKTSSAELKQCSFSFFRIELICFIMKYFSFFFHHSLNTLMNFIHLNSCFSLFAYLTRSLLFFSSQDALQQNKIVFHSILPLCNMVLVYSMLILAFARASKIIINGFLYPFLGNMNEKSYFILGFDKLLWQKSYTIPHAPYVVRRYDLRTKKIG